ncbi:MAG: hemerythrin domain-containing protein [Pseudomonadota bacterium]
MVVAGVEPLDLPLLRLARHGQRVLDLCDLLEAIADDLPRKTMPVWREVAQLCGTIVPRHYDTLNRIFLPLLRRRTAGDVECEAVLTRLETEYSDSSHRLPELVSLLHDTVNNSPPGIDTEALGFALRGFFEAIRRQMAWEMDVLIPLARRRLTREDLDELVSSFARHAVVPMGRDPAGGTR